MIFEKIIKQARFLRPVASSPLRRRRLASWAGGGRLIAGRYSSGGKFASGAPPNSAAIRARAPVKPAL